MNMVGKTFNRIFWGTSALAQISWNIVNFNEKLLFSPLYFASSLYIFARFANSRPSPWLLGVLLFGEGWGGLFVETLLTELVGLMMGDMGGDTVGGTSSRESVIGVFFSLKLIWCESNVPSDNRYFYISAFVHYVGSSSCKALNRDLAIVVLDFSIQTPRFRRNLRSLHTSLLFTSLKSSSVYPLKLSWNDSHKSSSFQSYVSHVVIALAMFSATDSWVVSIFFSFCCFSALLTQVKSFFRGSTLGLAVQSNRMPFLGGLIRVTLFVYITGSWSVQLISIGITTVVWYKALSFYKVNSVQFF